jgi:hypothetical protein
MVGIDRLAQAEEYARGLEKIFGVSGLVIV